MKKFGRKTTLNLRYGSDKGSHSVVSDWKGYDFMEIVEKKETKQVGTNGGLKINKYILRKDGRNTWKMKLG